MKPRKGFIREVRRSRVSDHVLMFVETKGGTSIEVDLGPLRAAEIAGQLASAGIPCPRHAIDEVIFRSPPQPSFISSAWESFFSRRKRTRHGTRTKR